MPQKKKKEKKRLLNYNEVTCAPTGIFCIIFPTKSYLLGQEVCKHFWWQGYFKNAITW